MPVRPAVNRVRARISHGCEAGFTLVELVIVLIVIGVLLAIAVPSVLGQRNRANDAVAASSLRQAAPAIKGYFQDNETYAGMSPAGLRAAYDQSLPASLTLSSLTDTSYCAQSSFNGRIWRQNGPGAPIERASC
jgi:prepilin-type N-terminal cleavage/methylation domain-containing protein